MMIKKKVQDALVKQINSELYSGYLYLAMGAHLEAQNLSGFASWMKKQAAEEYEHAMRIYKYVYDRGGQVTLGAIAKPPARWASPLAAFKEAYEHECKVTAMIDDLVKIARSEKDNATESMLKWFVDEQVEEEEQTDAIVQKLKMIGSHAPGLMMLDAELGRRE
jgi:ferritin